MSTWISRRPPLSSAGASVSTARLRAIENRACLAEYLAGSLTLHSTTQIPGIVRDALAEALDLPANSVRVIAPDVGGGFGGKASVYPEELLVAAAARELGRPVKWTSDRLEDLVSTSQAFDETIDAELGVHADGTIAGLRADVIGDIGAYSIFPWTAGLEPVQHARRADAETSDRPYRGGGRPISTFVLERLLDMAAVRLKLDPKDLRLRNLIRPEEFPYKTAPGIAWDRCEFIECLNTACKTIGYDRLRRQQAQARAQGRWVGIGVACF